MALPRYERGLTRHPLGEVPRGLRGAERSVPVPEYARDAVAALITSWEFKRRAGFDTPVEEPRAGREGTLAKRVFGVRFAEPIRVVWADAHGFGYETRPVHPIYGEESFVLDGGVFTARSVSRASTPFWWMLTPALRVMQRSVFDRYIRTVGTAIHEARRHRSGDPG